ncbi:hypothetical protein Tsubulata_030467 [Turnera subulata]|uniref:DUF3615 domain-containing protein n=1 Tax=Turnera subulata TaxID=218843 RepID=A0A9Q0FY70_9ROSI|nr:hypothetical protein Tsubulata_030467 [Turnera subulata]
MILLPLNVVPSDFYTRYDEERTAAAGGPPLPLYTPENPHPDYVLQQEVIREAEERLASRPPAYSRPWKMAVPENVEIVRKMDWEKFYREFGEDYALSGSFNLKRYDKEGNPHFRPEVFMEASTIDVEYYNRTHLGFEVELVEPVKGKKIMRHYGGWEHFNFHAKSKNPDAADQTARLFFGERYLGKREFTPYGFPAGCVGESHVEESHITICIDLEERNTIYRPPRDVHFKRPHLDALLPPHLPLRRCNFCEQGCHPLDGVVHPSHEGFLRFPRFPWANHPPGRQSPWGWHPPATVYRSSSEFTPYGIPDGCVGEPQITICVDLEERNTTYKPPHPLDARFKRPRPDAPPPLLDTRFKPPHLDARSNFCYVGCHRLDDIIHPLLLEGFVRFPRVFHSPGSQSPWG